MRSVGGLDQRRAYRYAVAVRKRAFVVPVKSPER